MTMWLKYLTGAGLAITTAAFSLPVMAQDVPQTIPDAINDLMSTYSGTYFENRSIARQTQLVLGLSFRDREIDWDANAINQAYQDLMVLQNTLDPFLRVPDLPNPYNTSLLTMPGGQGSTVGTEFIFESMPLQ